MAGTDLRIGMGRGNPSSLIQNCNIQCGVLATLEGRTQCPKSRPRTPLSSSWVSLRGEPLNLCPLNLAQNTEPWK